MEEGRHQGDVAGAAPRLKQTQRPVLRVPAHVIQDQVKPAGAQPSESGSVGRQAWQREALAGLQVSQEKKRSSPSAIQVVEKFKVTGAAGLIVFK